MIGSTVGRYRIDSLLGEGGMGRVYKAFDTTLGRPAALKVLDANVVSDDERLQRFMREARTASSLNHPNVVTIYEVGPLPDQGHFIAMELVDGETLRETLSHGRPDLPRALDWMAQVADGIATAHAAGVTHRDLKPENIVIARTGFAKILDFGLAKLHERPNADPETKTAVMNTTPGTVLGTVGYMSPEQARGTEVDHRSDIFSIGCILYECVTGRRPFIGDSQVDTLHKIIYNDPPPVEDRAPDAPRDLQRILRKALAKDPENRYQSARDLAIDLRDLKSELHSQPRAIATPESPKVRAGAPWIPLAAIALSAIAAVIVLWPRRDRVVSPAPQAAPAPMSMTRVTNSRNVIGSAISPDGEYVAYAYSDAGQHSLWVRQLATGSALELVPPAPIGLWGLRFAPDSRSIYYALKSQKHPSGGLFKIPILGGDPRLLLTNIESAVTFSPDGKQLAFHRIHTPNPGQSSIVIANIDGTNERTVVTKTPPEYLAPSFWGAPAWLPDGSIATSYRDEKSTKIVAVDVSSGATRADLAEGFSAAGSIDALHDGGIVFTASPERGRPGQIYLALPGNKTPRRITNDLLDYRTVTVTRDSQALLAVASDTSSAVWRTSLEPGATPVKLTSGRDDGNGGIAVGPDGSIVFAAQDTGRWQLYELSGDGTRRHLNTGEFAAIAPAVSPDGRFIVFKMFRGSDIVWARMDRDGSNLRVLCTFVPPVGPQQSVTFDPDVRSVYFAAGAENVKRIWRVSIDGGTPERVTDFEADRPAISPDGKQMAMMGAAAILVGPVDGKSHRRIENISATSSSVVAWSADGKALIHNAGVNDRTNLWLHPLDGTAPRKLTRFDDEYVLRFAVSPDARTAVLARGVLSRDAVLIKNFR